MEPELPYLNAGQNGIRGQRGDCRWRSSASLNWLARDAIGRRPWMPDRVPAAGARCCQQDTRNTNPRYAQVARRYATFVSRVHPWDDGRVRTGPIAGDRKNARWKLEIAFALLTCNRQTPVALGPRRIRPRRIRGDLTAPTSRGLPVTCYNLRRMYRALSRRTYLLTGNSHTPGRPASLE